MTVYFDTASKKFIGEVDEHIQKVALDYYRGMIDAKLVPLGANLVFKVQRTTAREEEHTYSDAYTISAYQQMREANFTIVRNEK